MTFWRSFRILLLAGNDLIRRGGADLETAPGELPLLPPEPIRPEALRTPGTRGGAFLALLRETPRATTWVVLLSCLWALLNAASPVLLFRFLGDLPSATPGNALRLAAGYSMAFLLVSMAVGLVGNVIDWYKFQFSQTVAIDLANALFSHALRMDGNRLQGLDPGTLLNRLSLDTKALALYLGEVSLVTLNLVSLVLGNLFLYRTLGSLGLVSVALLLLLSPLLRALSSAFYRHEMGAARHRDLRVGALSRALQQIRTIKAMGLEAAVKEEIGRPRAQEMNERRKFVGNLARFLFTTTFLNAGVVVATFALFLARGHALTPAIAFSSLAMLRVIRRVVETIPLCTSGLSERLLALERIRGFWTLEAREHG